jgi:hypothetical protein
MKATRIRPTDPALWPTTPLMGGPVEIAILARAIYIARMAQQEAEWAREPAHRTRRACYYVGPIKTARTPRSDPYARQNRAEIEL